MNTGSKQLMLTTDGTDLEEIKLILITIVIGMKLILSSNINRKISEINFFLNKVNPI
jgi:hypothetical protein